MQAKEGGALIVGLVLVATAALLGYLCLSSTAAATAAALGMQAKERGALTVGLVLVATAAALISTPQNVGKDAAPFGASRGVA